MMLNAAECPHGKPACHRCVASVMERHSPRAKRVDMGNGAAWPIPDGDLEQTLRYGEPSKEDCILAASILAAYAYMVGDCPAKDRSAAVRAIRAWSDSVSI